MVNNIAATRNDFDNLASLFNDTTWSYTNMRNYFKRIEHNLYLNESDSDHDLKGWLKTNLNPISILVTPQFAGTALMIMDSTPSSESSRSQILN